MHHQTVRTFRDFRDEVIGEVELLPALDMPITDVLGCLVERDVTSPGPVPGYRRVTVEGFAVRTPDIATASPQAPVVLAVVDTVPAGYSAAEPLMPGQAVRISVGAPMPDNADGVVPLEGAAADGEKVTVSAPARSGDGFQSSDALYREGDVIVPAGTPLDHAGIAAMAISGQPRVLVHPRPRVVVITIGSELVPVSDSSTPGLVHDAVGVLLTTSVRSLGADGYRVGPIADEGRAVRDTIEDQLVRADLIVTAGGIAAEGDVVRRELSGEGVARFDGPPLPPLRAYGLGTLGSDGVPIVCLPGDPGAAFLGFQALVRPLVGAMLGSGNAAGVVGTVLSSGEVSEGSRLVPGHWRDDRFTTAAVDSPTLRDLVGTNAMTVQHAGEASAEVVVVASVALRWPVRLVEGRMQLRPLRLRDARAWRSVRSHNAAWLHPWDATLPAPDPVTPMTFSGMVRANNRDARAGRALPFALFWEDALIGQVTVGGISWGSLRSAYIGYWIDQRYAGRGLMPRAVALAGDHCLSELGLHRLEINIRPENTASLAVVAKLGLRNEGIRQRYLHINGQWCDHYSFAVTAEERPEGMRAWLASHRPGQAHLPAQGD